MPLSGNSNPGVQGYCAKSFDICVVANNTMLQRVTETLQSCFMQIANNPNHTDVEYWANQGSNGAQQLAVFGAWKAGLLAVYAALGETPPEWLPLAGNTLVAHQDGTVTVG